ncbi:isochorismatase family protein [Paenibacillus sp. HN-1]|uniref:isochorismatase family protein n=1 Tax=Paenibacillus TaxID=44249 RepID=UPI001CA9AC82|nr:MULTISPECIES: isochorismatase family protein [Paenibacillus]MBY9080147.1 isochorismatase family protein [Paenibacillus sp. CGMCC 1.18879]MBY9087779.1 isochorismatase family protein [Paenibacillus sinensis]
MNEMMSHNGELLDPNKTALVVIDLQNGIAGTAPAAPYSGAQVVERAVRLKDAFAARDAYIVLVTVSWTDGKDAPAPKTDLVTGRGALPEGFDRLVPELGDVPGAHLIVKRQWGAFYGTDLDLQLRRRGIDTIVLCGISTSIGVDTTAREAYQHGYNQVFVTDAMTARNAEEHEYVCKTIFPRIGRIRTTEQVVELMKRL